MEKLGQEGKFDFETLNRIKVPTIEYAGKRSEGVILPSAVDWGQSAPLQVVRSFGDPGEDGWQNLIIQGDNLQFLKTVYLNQDPLIQNRVKGKVKLVYIDPPFATKSEFQGGDGARSYFDKIESAEFLENMRERLLFLREVLSEDGFIFLHLDNKKVHFLKVMMDEIFDLALKPFELPEFPEIHFKLGYRTTIDKETQTAILDEIYRISYLENPKIHLGIKWLCTYIAIRPGKLVKILEEDIDLGNGYIRITDPKMQYGGDPKVVPILEEDLELIRSLRRGFPKMRFFRHGTGVNGCKEGQPFGDKYFYKWWRRACANLEIAGVDLYGGTRHSSAVALRKFHSPELIKKSTMHTTNE
jgi:integrase